MIRPFTETIVKKALRSGRCTLLNCELDRLPHFNLPKVRIESRKMADADNMGDLYHILILEDEAKPVDSKIWEIYKWIKHQN